MHISCAFAHNMLADASFDFGLLQEPCRENEVDEQT